MYSVHGSQKRGLLRPHSAGGSGPIFRNLPLFGFLAGLVLFFFIFYVYQAQSTELNMLREQIELERNQLARIKTESIDLKAQVEKCKNNEADWKKQLSSISVNKEECDANLKDAVDKVQSYTVQLEKLRQEKSTCMENFASINSQLEQSNRTIGELRADIATMEKFVHTQKETIERLQLQLQGNVPSGQVNPNANLSAQQNAVAIPQNANELANDGNAQRDEKALAAQVVSEPPRNMQVADAVEKTKAKTVAADGNALNQLPSNKPQAAATTAAARQIEIGSVETNDNVLAPPPAQSDKQPSQIKNDEKPLHEPPKLEDVLGMKKDFGAAKEKNQLKNANENGNAGDGKKVVGGEYEENTAEEDGPGGEENDVKNS